MKEKRKRHLRKTWEKHFIQPFKDTRRWTNIVNVPSHMDEGSFGQLFADCFTHHNDVRFSPEDEDAFHFQQDPRRIIRKNNLTAFFQKQFTSQDSFVSADIYESPNYEEKESELGEPAGFDHFFQCVMSSPFSKLDVNNQSLGENRITFLIGEVGIGKTFLVSRTAREIAHLDSDLNGFKVIPVYACMETFVASHGNTDDAPELIRQFLLFLADLIRKSVKQFSYELNTQIQLTYSPVDATTEQISLNIREYIHDLARCGSTPARVVIFVDNFDVLHYQNSRYIFFPEEYTKHRRFIEEKIVKLIFLFVDPNILGDAGICVCITSRQNVARESKIINQPALPRRMELEGHIVFQLGKVDALDVVDSRMRMYERVLLEFSKIEDVNNYDLDFHDSLALIKAQTTQSVAPSNLSDGLRRISELSHHGARSLVEFLGKLRLNLIRQNDAVERLFSHSPWLLERLYISSLHQRYSQSQGHFPNLFLVDGKSTEERKDVVHIHSYWLKYVLLKRIGSSHASGISVQELINEFVNDFGYDEDLVRLTLGSLVMVNESRCIEIIGAAQDECQSNLVRLTQRGKVLIGEHPDFSFPYCFEFSYLEMVIDDHILSLPRRLYSQIAVDTSIGYALFNNDKYPSRMRSDLVKKIPATLVFLRVLEGAWICECRQRKELAANSQLLGPNFDVIYSKIEDSVRGIAASLAAFNADKYLEELKRIREDKLYLDVYSEYMSDCKGGECDS